MPNPMLSRTVSWRCEPCGVEEKFEQHAVSPRCWVCGEPMLPGPHSDWPMTSTEICHVQAAWINAHTDERRSA